MNHELFEPKLGPKPLLSTEPETAAGGCWARHKVSVGDNPVYCNAIRKYNLSSSVSRAWCSVAMAMASSSIGLQLIPV